MATPPAATPDYASACIRVGDFDVTYLTAAPAGREDDPTLETVVLLHGFGAWAEVIWGSVIPTLARKYRVIAPDLLGFGRSSKPGEAFFDSPEPLAPGVRFLDAFLEATGVESCTVVGNSFGGGIALRMAATRPHRVKKLVLVNSMGLGRSIHPVYKAIALPGVGFFLSQPDQKRIRQMWRTLVHSDYAHRVTEDVIQQNFDLLSEPGALEVFAAARLGVNLAGQKLILTQFLPKVTQPTLVVWGKQDRVFPVRHGERAAKRIPNARLVVLDPCGHIPPFECPDAFLGALLPFLDGAESKEATPSAAALHTALDVDAADGLASG